MQLILASELMENLFSCFRLQLDGILSDAIRVAHFSARLVRMKILLHPKIKDLISEILNLSDVIS